MISPLIINYASIISFKDNTLYTYNRKVLTNTIDSVIVGYNDSMSKSFRNWARKQGVTVSEVGKNLQSFIKN